MEDAPDDEDARMIAAGRPHRPLRRFRGNSSPTGEGRQPFQSMEEKESDVSLAVQIVEDGLQDASIQPSSSAVTAT